MLRGIGKPCALPDAWIPALENKQFTASCWLPIRGEVDTDPVYSRHESRQELIQTLTSIYNSLAHKPLCWLSCGMAVQQRGSSHEKADSCGSSGSGTCRLYRCSGLRFRPWCLLRSAFTGDRRLCCAACGVLRQPLPPSSSSLSVRSAFAGAKKQELFGACNSPGSASRIGVGFAGSRESRSDLFISDLLPAKSHAWPPIVSAP